MQVYEQPGNQGLPPAKYQRDDGIYQPTPVENKQNQLSPQRNRLPETYDFRAPDRVDVERLNGKYTKANEFTEKRINALAKISGELANGEDRFLEEEGKLVEGAINFIDENVRKFRELLEKEYGVRVQLEGNLNDRQIEFNTAQVKSEEARVKIRAIEDVIKEQAKTLVTLNSEKEKAAYEIGKHMQLFNKVKMREPKDQGHELFKWFLGVIYNESQAKYDFENFKKEVLKRDKGSDFVERMKGFRAFGLGKDEVAQTNKLLLIEKEVTLRINHKNKPRLQAPINASFNYVKVIDKINHIMEDMRRRETELDATSEQVDKANAELDKSRSRKNDAETSLQISNKAIQTFEYVLRLFQANSQKCRERRQYIAETLPNLQKSLVKPKKTEFETRGREEETVFGSTSQQEGIHPKAHVHKEVRANYQSDVTEVPPEQKEGCKCTIF